MDKPLFSNLSFDIWPDLHSPRGYWVEFGQEYSCDAEQLVESAGYLLMRDVTLRESFLRGILAAREGWTSGSQPRHAADLSSAPGDSGARNRCPAVVIKGQDANNVLLLLLPKEG